MRHVLTIIVALGALAIHSHACAGGAPVGTAFTYQGQLRQGGAALDGSADLQFTLWDAASVGTQVAGTVAANQVTVSNGAFVVPVDFGSVVFNGDGRWLEIRVRSPAGNGAFTTLSPRQPLTAVPYAMQTRGIFADASGNVGIATTTPIDPLTVGGPFGGAMSAVYGAVRTGVRAGASAGYLGTFSGHALMLRTNNIDRLTIDPQGNVGIGVFPGNERLTVAGSMEIGTNSGDYQHLRIGGGNSNGYLYGSYANLGDGIHLGYNWYADAAGAGHVINSGGATSRISVGYGTVDLATSFSAGSAPSTVMRVGYPTWINSSALGVGTTTPAYVLHLGFGNAGKPGGGTWANSSDIRLKKNIEPMTGSLDRLLRLRGVTFKYIDPKAINELEGPRMGMIAQEVERVFPDWVEQRHDGYKSVTYRGFEALTVEALRDLRTGMDAEIAALRAARDAEFSVLEAENAALRASLLQLTMRLDALEASIQRDQP